MAMGVNRGHPPGTMSQSAPLYQDYLQDYVLDANHGGFNRMCQLNHANQPHMISPNHVIPYQKQAMYQDQGRCMLKKTACMKDHTQQAGFIRESTPTPGIMCSHNGMSQSMHSGLSDRYISPNMMQGYEPSPNQSQFSRHMCPDQNQIHRGMLWYENTSPQGGIPVRYGGRQGEQPMQMSSPTQPMALSPQQQHIRHMLMLPGQAHTMSPVRTMGACPHLQHYQDQTISEGVVHSSSQSYLPRHYHPRHILQSPHIQRTLPQHVAHCSPQQVSPGVPYSQALEGLSNPTITHVCDSHSLKGGTYIANSANLHLHTQATRQLTTPHSILQTVLSNVSNVHNNSVYTMANTHTLQNITSSTGTVMSGNCPQPTTNVCCDTLCQTSSVTSSTKAINQLAVCGKSHESQVFLLPSVVQSKSDMLGSKGSDECGDSERDTVQKSYLDVTNHSKHSAVQTSSITLSMAPVLNSSALLTETADDVTTVTVPFAWKRVVENGAVIYFSPDEIRLDSSAAVLQYLDTEGTCKCGLGCPLIVGKAFNFNPEVASKNWSPDSVKSKDDLNNLCNHKRKMIAMATLQTTSNMHSTSQLVEGQQAASRVLEALSLCKKDAGKEIKGKVRTSVNQYDEMLVSQLLLHHDKMHNKQLTQMAAKAAVTRSTEKLSDPDNKKLCSPSLETTSGEMKMEPMPRALGTGPVSSEYATVALDGHPSFGVPIPSLHSFMQLAHGQSLHCSRYPYEMLMGIHQKQHSSDSQMIGFPMPLNLHKKSCMQSTSQMFSLQLQMQAQVAAARTSGHQCSMPSPSLSTHSRRSTPDSGHFAESEEIIKTSLPGFDQSSPSPSLSHCSGLSMAGCQNSHMMAFPQIVTSGSLSPLQNVHEPHTQPVKKKKRKKDALDKAVRSLLERTTPCPHLDFGKFLQKCQNHRNLSSDIMEPLQGKQMTSFMNDSAFVSQHSNEERFTCAEDLPIVDSGKGQVVSKDDSLEHPIDAEPAFWRNSMYCKSDSRQSTVEDLSTFTQGSAIDGFQEESLLSSKSGVCQDKKLVSSQHHSQDDSKCNVSNELETKHHSMSFPASCLLSAAARAKLPSTLNSNFSAPVNSLSSWSTKTNRFRMSSDLAPIRHVPPGGQHIGGGSIVYHHNIENQQAFHEGGVVNGGGILMMSGPAHKHESYMVNCLSGSPPIQDTTLSSMGLDLLPNHVADAPMLQNAIDAVSQKQLKNSDQDLQANPIQTVQNLISGTGGNNLAIMAQTKLHPDNPIDELVLSDSEVVQMPNLPLPSMSDCAMTTAMDSTTETITPAISRTTSNLDSQATKAVVCGSISDSKLHSIDFLNLAPAAEVLSAKEDDTTVKVESKCDKCCDQSTLFFDNHDSISTTCQTECGSITKSTLNTRLSLKARRKKKKMKVRASRKSVKTDLGMDPQEDTRCEMQSNIQSLELRGETMADLVKHEGREASGVLSPHENSGFMSRAELMEQGQLLIDRHQFIQTQGQELDHVCIASQGQSHGQSQMASAQGEATNIIQTLSFVPNMVGIDPNTGLVQSIHMPMSSQPETPASDLTTAEQVTSQAQVVQTVMQSLHIQNNVLVQSVSPTGMSGTFIQPTLIPIFPSPVSVGSNSEKGALSVVSVNPLDQIEAEGQSYVQLQKPNSNVVSTQTEAVQTEDCGSEYMDVEGGGRLLMESEDGILADDSCLAEGDDVVCHSCDVSQDSASNQTCSASITSEITGETRPSSVCSVGASPDVACQGETYHETRDVDSIAVANTIGSSCGANIVVTSPDASFIILGPEARTVATSQEASNLVTSGEASLKVNLLASNPGSNIPVVKTEVTDKVDSNSEHTSILKLNLSLNHKTSTCAKISKLGGFYRHEVEDKLLTNQCKLSAGDTSIELGTRDPYYPIKYPMKTKDSNASSMSGDKNQDKQEKGNYVNCELKPGIDRISKNTFLHIHSLQDNVLLQFPSDVLRSSPDNLMDGDMAVQIDSELTTMPFLPEEILLSKRRNTATEFLRPITPAMAIIENRLEHSIKHFHDADLEKLDTTTDLLHYENGSALLNEVQEPLHLESFSEPPALPLVAAVCSMGTREIIFTKSKRGRTKRRPRKIVRRAFGNRYVQLSPSCKDHCEEESNANLEVTSLNNNKVTDIIVEKKDSKTITVQSVEKMDNVQSVAKSEEVIAQMKSISTGGSSDGEANQSSDSSQSMPTSEGDDVRHGNSPSIRCSNLLTSSPETGEMNCTGMTDFDKLENMYSEVGRNYIQPIRRRMKTRKSLRKPFTGTQPRHGVKRVSSRKKSIEVTEPSCASASDTCSLPPGELVWAPFKSYSSWPGKVIAAHNVPKNPQGDEGKVWVRWFGFHTYSQVKPQELKTLTEGLEAHHDARQKHRKGRKLNSTLETAIHEAMVELDHQMEVDSFTVAPPTSQSLSFVTEVTIDTKVNLSHKKKKVR